jgi:hypothetical protein
LSFFDFKCADNKNTGLAIESKQEGKLRRAKRSR